MHLRNYNVLHTGDRCVRWGNGGETPDVYSIVKVCICLVPFLCAALAVGFDEYSSAKQKVGAIEGGRLRAGSRVTLTYPELTAWVMHEAPAGVRNPQLKVSAPGIATGSALIDFGKIQRAQGNEPSWLMSKLLDGERPVSVRARIRSSGGQATVDVERVEVSGIALDGSTLDFLIRNVLVPMYPNAVVGRPFELGDRIERLDVQPAGVGVVIGR
jgi:hypothetical protein